VFTFDASGSTDPDNEDISFFWDFGDGNTSTKPIISHTYSESGVYTVTLTITDNSGLECGTALTTQKVKVNIPPFVTFTSDDMVCAGEAVVFDASESYDDSNNPLSYEWDFGDGTTARGDPIVNKSFSQAGKYTVTLTADDNSETVCSEQTKEKEIYVNEPPIAEAGESTLYQCVSEPTDLEVSFDASASSDPNSDPLNFTWDFGDGQRAQGPQVKHKYSSLGNYDVKLVVKDNTNLGCGASVDFVTVKLNQAPEADAGDDTLACSGEVIEFDGSSSYKNHKKGTLLFDWSFGDGEEAKGMQVSHTYDKPGTYKANLSVSNELNPMCPPAKDTRKVIINSSPSVKITTVDSVCLGTKVQFDASSATDLDGDPLEFYWSFGDGTILKAGPKVSHLYKRGGTYRVTVIVDDTKETACSTATATVDIKVNTPPVADAGANTSCCVDVEAKFDASASSDADGDPLTYTWDFGDGTKTNGAIVTHTYTKSGAYNVTLTVDDNAGTSCSKSTAGFVADINSQPVPVMTIR
jgi:PKD repeat protein